MNLGDLHKVWETKALKKPGQDEAKKMLEKIAKQVQPIMRKHKWRVKVLSEFWYSLLLFRLFPEKIVAKSDGEVMKNWKFIILMQTHMFFLKKADRIFIDFI